MEILKYQIEDTTIVELLGRQNFTTKESAVLELVKNAFDAFAKEVDIYFEDNKLIIKDNGKGMDSNDIKTKWMHVGHSYKDYVEEYNGEERILSGSKGIGRFALSRLGNKVIVESKKVNCDAVKWSTNWESSYIEKIEREELGTIIYISGLRDKWNFKEIDKLITYLSKSYNDDKMKITLHCPQEQNDLKKVREINKHFNDNDYILGKNYLSDISFNYNSKEKILYYIIKSDEFKPDINKYCDFNFYEKKDNINIYKKFNKDYINDEDNDLIGYDIDLFETLGDFNGKLFFSFKPTKEDADRFLYKHISMPPFDSGIILYRNSFSISSFEGTKDWLQLGKRSRKSPAAATHPTGSWRVKENQMAGFINIDKKNNKSLKELSNRQGFEEDEYYELFLDIILTVIEEFESYRQSIIRKVNSKNIIEEIVTPTVFQMLEKKPDVIHMLNHEQRSQLIVEIMEFKNDTKKILQNKEDSEKRYKYDVRILNLLSTLGLKASSIAHELHNDRSYIYANVDNIINKLKSLDMWDEISSIENTRFEYENIPHMLQYNKEINIKMIEFMNTMLYDIEKHQFDIILMNISDEITNLTSKWIKEYSWVNFVIDIDNSILLKSTRDVIKVVFDNLILNSIQQNDKRKNLEISINVERVSGVLKFNYCDNGVGLPAKYIDNPNKILEVHESSRKDGHGLGMWIISNTLEMTGGEILNINGKNGFKIEFTVGEKI